MRERERSVSSSISCSSKTKHCLLCLAQAENAIQRSPSLIPSSSSRSSITIEYSLCSYPTTTVILGLTVFGFNPRFAHQTHEVRADEPASIAFISRFSRKSMRHGHGVNTSETLSPLSSLKGTCSLMEFADCRRTSTQSARSNLFQ